MKKRLAVWVIFVIIRLPLSLDPSFAPSLLAQPGLGAASIAKGGVSLGDPNPLWALWNDPSGLVGFDLNSFELATSGLDSARAQAWGVGLYDSGDELFRESKLRLGWATATTDWAVGMAMNLNHVGFGGGYESLVGWSLGLQARYRVFKRSWVLFGVDNPSRSPWRSVSGLDKVERIPSRMRAGVFWHANAEPDWSPVHVQLKSFYKKDQSGILLVEMPSFGSDWGLFSGTKAEQSWEIAAQYHPSPTLNMYSTVGSSKEPKASGYDRFPEQRSYWAVQLHYEPLAIPLRMQFDILRKIQQNTWRANGQIGY